VHQDVHRPQCGGQRPDLVQVGQVADHQLGVELGRDRPAAFLAAAVHDHLVAGRGQLPGRGQADPVGGSGDADRRHAIVRTRQAHRDAA